MKKKSIIFIGIIILLMLLHTISYGKTSDELYNEIYAMVDSNSSKINYEDIDRYLSDVNKITIEDLKIIQLDNDPIHSNLYESATADVPDLKGGSSSKTIRVLAIDEINRRNNKTENGNTGSNVQKDKTKAKEKAEEIREEYSKIEDIENVDTKELKRISNMINELVQLDGMKGTYYQSIIDISIAISGELDARNESAGTAVDQEQNVLESEIGSSGQLLPKTGNKEPDQLATYKPNEKTSPDEIISDGTDFLNTGKKHQENVLINGDNVHKASNMLFNVLFTIGVGASILIGMYIGIKFMLSSAEDKATLKESLLPYFAGVIIMFASFSIWKLILVLLQALDNI